MTDEEFDKALYSIICDLWKAYRESKAASSTTAMVEAHERLYNDYCDNNFDLLHFMQLMSNELMMIYIARKYERR